MQIRVKQVTRATVRDTDEILFVPLCGSGKSPRWQKNEIPFGYAHDMLRSLCSLRMTRNHKGGSDGAALFHAYLRQS